MYANLVGFDDDLWSLVEQQDDICQRLIRLVLGRVDSSIDVSDDWPKAPFDCMYMARVVNKATQSREMIYRALDGDLGDSTIAIPAQGAEHLSRLDEACKHAAAIQNPTAKAIVNHVLRLCIDDAVSGMDRPIGQFDTVYLAKMVERAFSTAPGNIRLILAGRGWKLDWE
jgi:hypothetical protein